jgi:type II secretory pathway pseudopilin PulG
MDLEGQDSRSSGYAMAALLVALGVMAVLMSVAMPVWRHQGQREKEAELVFRGEQYARAVYLYRRKNGGTSPPNIDLLVQQRYLRKKYKDPMTEDGEFQIIPMGGVPQAGTGGPTGRAGGLGPGGLGQPGRGSAGGRGLAPPIQPGTVVIPGGPGQFAAGGIQGVVSKSTQASIRIYRGGTHYNQWQFIAPVQQQPGGPGQQGPGMGPGRGGRGGPGGPGSGPGGGRGPGRGRGVGPGGRGETPGRRGGPFPIRPPGGRGLSH